MKNISLYRNSDLRYQSLSPCHREGRFAIVTERGAGCDGRCGVRCLHRAKRPQRTAKSCGPGAATLASIRPACAGTATVTIKAAHRGEHEVSRQTIARGKPGCLGCTCQTRVRSFYHCTRLCGRSRRPAFPAPSLRSRANEYANLRRNRAVRTRAHVCRHTLLSSPGLPPSLKLRRRSELVARRSPGGDGTGRPSIPETLVIKPICRSVLDHPLSRVMTSWGLRSRIYPLALNPTIPRQCVKQKADGNARHSPSSQW